MKSCEKCIHYNACKRLIWEEYEELVADNCEFFEEQPPKKQTTCIVPKNNTAFDHTIELMRSGDYKKRFKAEYMQTKIRYEKLKALNTRIEAAQRTALYGMKTIEEPKHTCPEDILREQQSAMGGYLHVLELRAVIEGIEL